MKPRLILLTTILLLVVLQAQGLAMSSRNVPQPPGQLVRQSPTESTSEATLSMAYSEAIGGDNSTYHFQRNGAGYTATNPIHNLSVDVTDSALTISIGEETWQLTSDNAVHNFTAADNRLSIHRDGFDEWYVNGPVGLQQGFTLYEPAEIAFDVGGTLTTTASAQSLSLGDGLTFLGLMAYDASGRNVPVEFDLEGNKLVYAYDDAAAAYPLTIDPWLQQAKLTPDDGAASDYFGGSVALDGDTALVGAPEDDCTEGFYCGSAYIFVRSGTTWIQQAKLSAADVTDFSYFGTSVALEGDTALVGAPGAGGKPGIAGRGHAYVFVRSGTIWTQQAKLAAADGLAGDYFGSSVALSGESALVGASVDDCAAGIACGSAYVFVRSGTTWSQQAKLTAADRADWDRFGYSVALSGDTALIGTNLDDDKGIASGSAYVFVRSGTAWSQQTKLTAADGTALDQFGYAVAVDGDTALIGAIGDTCLAGGGCGSAYVFTRSGITWSQQAKLLPADWQASFDYFGYSVALDGDTALIGANGHGGAGSAYTFVKSGMTWTQQHVLWADDGVEWDYFGAAVALDGDTALVGAPDEDTRGDGSGSAYAFIRRPPLIASVVCNGPNLEVTISSGYGPFAITGSAGINIPVYDVDIGTTMISGPEKWDNLAVVETSGRYIDLGSIKCRSSERPTPVSPVHQAHTPSSSPLFTWTGITDANNYRLWVFDDATPANRTVDIRENSDGPTQLTLTQPLAPDRYFWRVRGRQNRVWSLWSIRFTLFIDPSLASPMSISTTPVPLDAPNIRPTLPPPPTSEPSSDGASITPTLPAPPNSR